MFLLPNLGLWLTQPPGVRVVPVYFGYMTSQCEICNTIECMFAFPLVSQNQVEIPANVISVHV